jgi:argininosuccinate synthase
VQAEAVARYARRAGARAIAHGSTGAGNDQFRFDAALSVLAPSMEVLAPVRDSGVSRREESEYCRMRGVLLPAKTSRYSVNEGLWGTTIGGGETHDPWSLPPEDLFPGSRLAGAPRVPRTIVVEFSAGRPVSLDGRRKDPLEIVARLNALGRRYAAGRGIHLGDTILGAKGRIAFEAPAALMLVAAHAELEKLVLTREQRQLKALVADAYGRLLHEGMAFEPALSDAAAYLRGTQSRVTGGARVRVTAGSFAVVGVRSPHSLMDLSRVRYGEENAYLSAAEARGVAKTLALPGILAGLAAPHPEKR